jgi:hypothetical protein
MATTRIAVEFEARGALRTRDRRRNYGYAKSGIGRDFFMSLLMCFPVSCMMWAAIIYLAVRLAR